MDTALFGSELWKPALDKYAEATGLSVKLFALDGRLVFESRFATPLVALFREYGHEPGLFAECARRCLARPHSHPVVGTDPSHGAAVVGTTLVLEAAAIGVAVAGYALSRFCQVAEVHRWAKSADVPFHRLWEIVRRLAPVPERRLLLHGELLQVLGNALLHENHRTRQYEQAVVELKAANEAKDTFLAVLSHELRTPLAPIMGWAGLLKTAPSLQQVQQAATVIERNALLQSRMIDDLLDVTRIAQGTIALQDGFVDVSACVSDALEAIGPEIEKKGLRVERAGAAESLFVRGDVDRLQQVFRNILSNAAKFTPAGGGIRITLARDGNDACVVVADTGRGIAPEFLPFAFELFRQQQTGPRREYAGLGLGLMLVKKLTELHRGTVTLSSAGEGRGTQVTVRLPLVAEVMGAAAVPAPEAAAPLSLAGVSILVIDDVQDARETLQALLQRHGVEVAIAADGREALDMMPRVHPDLVLCDLRMPRMDGFEFLARLRRANPSGHPPVVAVSALASDLDRQRIRDAGFATYLKKPYDDETLVSAIGAALRRPVH